MLKTIKFFTALIPLLLAFQVFAQEPLRFRDAEQEARYNKLTLELRCAVCQNQTLADSDAPLAQDLRQEIYEMMQAGQSDEEIKAFMVDRYGDFVLYRPPLQGNTLALWIVPAVLLGGGAVTVFFTVRNRNRKLAAQQQKGKLVFWTIAAIALFLAALITFLPLLKGKSFWQPAALALIFLLPAAALWIYQETGTPEGIGIEARPQAATAAPTHTPDAPDMDTVITGLQDKLAENPDDVDGWMLLARSLKSMQRHPEAVTALEKALEIAPDNPMVMVELAESRVFVANEGRIPDDSVALLQRALALDPTLQKALWLLGIAAAQTGDYEYAIDQWETLLKLVEPGSQVAQSIQSQIDQARNELGQEVPVAASPAAEPAAVAAPVAAPAADDGVWRGTQLKIAAGDGLSEDIAARAVLYVMIRAPGPAVGPPIGVRRIRNPDLPLDLTISDKDSMLAERKISSETEIQLQARLSLSGSPAAGSGDWQSTTVTVGLDSGEPVALVLDQQVE